MAFGLPSLKANQFELTEVEMPEKFGQSLFSLWIDQRSVDQMHVRSIEQKSSQHGSQNSCE